MNITKTLDSLSIGRSQYEFENFFLETYPTAARRLIAVMLEIERIETVLQDTNSTLSEREKSFYLNQLAQLKEYYNNISDSEKKEILDNFESEESEYWCNVYGRNAAIELLTTGRTSTATMDKMAKLPPGDFERAVMICTSFTTLIQTTTKEVEASYGVFPEGLPDNSQ